MNKDRRHRERDSAVTAVLLYGLMGSASLIITTDEPTLTPQPMRLNEVSTYHFPTGSFGGESALGRRG